MNDAKYIQISQDYTQDLIKSMIQSVYNLAFKPLSEAAPTRRPDGFTHTYQGITIVVFPNGIDFDVEPTNYAKQIKWELVGEDGHRVGNLTPLDQQTRDDLGKVLRHYLDTTE